MSDTAPSTPSSDVQTQSLSRLLTSLARLDATGSRDDLIETLAQEIHRLSNDDTVSIYRIDNRNARWLVYRHPADTDVVSRHDANSAVRRYAFGDKPAAVCPALVIHDDSGPWGFVHYQTHPAIHPPALLHETAHALVRAASRQLRLIKASTYANYRKRLTGWRDSMTKDLIHLQTPAEIIQRHGDDWLSLFHAKGIAFFYHNELTLQGQLPSQSTLLDIIAQLADLPPDTRTVESRHLVLPPLTSRTGDDMLAGLLALSVSISNLSFGWLLMFREPASVTTPSCTPDSPPQQVLAAEQWSPTEKKAAIELAEYLAVATSTFEMMHLNRRLQASNSRLEHLAHTDPLTQCWNRHRIEQVMDAGLDAASRQGRHLALLMFDIDDFKRVNDTYGHEMGDEVLRELADTARGRLRSGDRLGRWGGEEFIVIANDTELDQAIELAKRLCHDIASRPIEPVGRITVSIGVAAWQPGDTRRQLVERADNGMYLAKRSGKNCVRAMPFTTMP